MSAAVESAVPYVLEVCDDVRDLVITPEGACVSAGEVYDQISAFLNALSDYHRDVLSLASEQGAPAQGLLQKLKAHLRLEGSRPRSQAFTAETITRLFSQATEAVEDFWRYVAELFLGTGWVTEKAIAHAKTEVRSRRYESGGFYGWLEHCALCEATGACRTVEYGLASVCERHLAIAKQLRSTFPSASATNCARALLGSQARFLGALHKRGEPVTTAVFELMNHAFMADLTSLFEFACNQWCVPRAAQVRAADLKSQPSSLSNDEGTMPAPQAWVSLRTQAEKLCQIFLQAYTKALSPRIVDTTLLLGLARQQELSIGSGNELQDRSRSEGNPAR